MEGIHKIVVPSPFAIGPVNLYLLTGEPLTLIDAGPNTSEAFSALSHGLNRLGYKISDLKQIVITHTHHDHFGLLAELLRNCQAEVICHPKAEPWLVSHDETWLRIVEYFTYLYHQAGLPEEMIISLAKESRQMLAMAESAMVKFKVTADGKMVKAGNDFWQVLYTPGHASNCICLYHPEKKLLLSGDHLLLKISSNPLLEPPEKNQAIRVSSLLTYLESQKRTADLDVLEVLPGHGKSFSNHREVVTKRFQQYENRQKTVYRLVSETPKTAYQICLEMFPQIQQGDLFLGLSEAFNHLDILVGRGMINKSYDGMLELFSK